MAVGHSMFYPWAVEFEVVLLSGCQMPPSFSCIAVNYRQSGSSRHFMQGAIRWSRLNSLDKGSQFDWDVERLHRRSYYPTGTPKAI